MISVSLTDNFSLLDKLLMRLERDQMPYAIARALTDMAQLAQKTITAEIPQIFSKGGPPKAFTVNSVVARPATKAKLQSEVFIKDTQAAYLALEETGGARSPRGAALLLPGSADAQLHDEHGNLPEGMLRKLRAAAKKTTKNGARAKRTLSRAAARKSGDGVPLPSEHQRDSGIVYFSQHGPHGRGTGGYYERVAGDGLRRLTGFEAVADYKPIFNYHGRIEAVVTGAFAPALMRRLQAALASR